MMNITEPYFTIFERQIPLYGICFYIGIIAAALVAIFICTHKHAAWYDVAYSGVYAMIGAIIGAKLLFLIVSFRQIINESIPLWAVIKGGFVFYGGLAGGAIGILIYAKQFRMQIAKLFEIYATVLPLGHAFGRLGCFFAGCCYGMPYIGKFSCTYHVSIGNTPTNISLFPIQLVEAIGLVVIFSLLLIVYLKTAEKCGVTPILYCFLYPILRFILEFFRGDAERGRYGWFSTSQWVSLVILMCVAAYLIRKALQNRKKTHSL